MGLTFYRSSPLFISSFQIRLSIQRCIVLFETSGAYIKRKVSVAGWGVNFPCREVGKSQYLCYIAGTAFYLRMSLSRRETFCNSLEGGGSPWVWRIVLNMRIMRRNKLTTKQKVLMLLMQPRRLSITIADHYTNKDILRGLEEIWDVKISGRHLTRIISQLVIDQVIKRHVYAYSHGRFGNLAQANMYEIIDPEKGFKDLFEPARRNGLKNLPARTRKTRPEIKI